MAFLDPGRIAADNPVMVATWTLARQLMTNEHMQEDNHSPLCDQSGWHRITRADWNISTDITMQLIW